VVKTADPAGAILQAAERLGVHAIVVGSHGRSGLERMLVGSVAEKVLRGASRPVVLAPRRR
jgi:nucleotide-binding universal stress UspA family protein